jgi:hypothetical protein
MCTTCDPKSFEYNERKGLIGVKLGKDIYIGCDQGLKNWKLWTESDGSQFTIYRCPTCGRKLF